MRSFTFSRAGSIQEAIGAAARADTCLIAGGTEMVNWLKEAIVSPARLVDISRADGLDSTITVDGSGLHIGALARMAEVAEHEAVRRDYPVIAEALLKSASAQLRNMATMGGNLLQRTRCPYFRAETELPCNKRRPGSGCAAWDGEDRTMAIFGWSRDCIATHPSDVAVAFAALDASVRLHSSAGARAVPLIEFHRLPGESPERDTVLAPGELIMGIDVPVSTAARRSLYMKVRERASYEFALVSAAVAIETEGQHLRDVRIALGGVAPKPWRLSAAEAALRGVALSDEPALRNAVTAGFADAQPRRHNAFKVELATRMVVRALQQLGGAA
jgi:xanthine dehydrogenase YagS FAD-binding subunit